MLVCVHCTVLVLLLSPICGQVLLKSYKILDKRNAFTQVKTAAELENIVDVDAMWMWQTLWRRNGSNCDVDSGLETRMIMAVNAIAGGEEL